MKQVKNQHKYKVKIARRMMTPIERMLNARGIGGGMWQSRAWSQRVAARAGRRLANEKRYKQ